MKRFLLLCLGLTAFVNAKPSLQVDSDRIEAGQTFNLQFIVPTQELPQNRGALRLETRNNFKLLGLDSADQVMRPDMDDIFNSFFGPESTLSRLKPQKRRVHKTSERSHG